MAFNRDKSNESITFDAIQISLASPDKILEWSYGEVTKPETINYRTLKPEKDGLFCERIFGPTKDWECACGKYKKNRYKGVICDKCGVEVTKSEVRRERMGHITLAAPVSHIWYFKGIPSHMGLILDISPKDLERVLYFISYIVTDPGDTPLKYKEILSESQYSKAVEDYGYSAFKAEMGAEAIQKLLRDIDVEQEMVNLLEELETVGGQRRTKVIKRLEVVEAFKNSNNKPEWMILTHIPVIPPELRPMVQLDGGRFATSDLNDLYRRIINRNNRLNKLMELKAPQIIIRNEKRMLQEAVDALIDNGRRGRAVTGPGNRNLKSLSDMLKGKQGRFRQNLLGKRVDYSGRSVIVVGPELKIYQCGLPKEMAIELFKPFVMKELLEKGEAHNVRGAKKMVEKLEPIVWDVLEKVIQEHPVMLNRAPTLHRLGIQAFEPKLVEGKAIKLHPLVCTAFNADFDGDQMAVHLPLSVEAQAECRFLLLSPNNLLKPSDGGPVAVPSQDMVLGIYYLTLSKDGEKGEGKIFRNVNEAIMAYENGEITLHSKIGIRRTARAWSGKSITKIVKSTLGRFIFNEKIHQDLGYVDRSIDENAPELEIDFLVRKKELKQILQKVIQVHGTVQVAELLDHIKSIGYKYSTRASMTVSISDMVVPESKTEIISGAEEKISKIEKQFKRGLITEEERYKSVVDIWKDADDTLTKALLTGLDKHNNIYMMADSGARGSDKQIKQLAGMRGLMADTSGRTIELPIKSNFREGLDVLEYFISAHGARKGLSDIALRTADSGYLTRRLVDVSQDLIIREDDCCCHNSNGEIPGMYVSALTDGHEVIESLEERITGRYLAEDIIDENGDVLFNKNTMITAKRAAEIVATGRKEVKIRTILTCKSKVGVCAKCYGLNLASGDPVHNGEAVGIIAAQSIGEPGTQLTMRTFHTGGVAGDDITQGLPRVEELFEARKPKGLAIISEISGIVNIKENKTKREIVVTDNEAGEAKTYLIPYGSRIKVEDGQNIVAGDELTEGSVNPHDILRIKGLRAVQDYMLREVQRVYRLQGVEINDKHIEVIVRQMLKKIIVDEAGDTDLIPGETIDLFRFNEANEKLQPGQREATGTRIMLGITKASLATNSFLSAASFQETTKVLTESAIYSKKDPLIGLKENVIIGKIIPAGTGLREYSDLTLDTEERIQKEKEELERRKREATKEQEEFTVDDYKDIIKEDSSYDIAELLNTLND